MSVQVYKQAKKVRCETYEEASMIKDRELMEHKVVKIRARNAGHFDVVAFEEIAQ